VKTFTLLLMLSLPTLLLGQSISVIKAPTVYQVSKQGKLKKTYKGKTLSEKEKAAKMKKDKAVLKSAGSKRRVSSHLTQDVSLIRYYPGDIIYIDNVLQEQRPDSTFIIDKNGRQKMFLGTDKLTIINSKKKAKAKK